MKKDRLLELDALRGLAAFAVVLFHYFYRYDQLYGHHGYLRLDWFQFGSLGVQLFFMISGYVIFWSLLRINRPLDFIVSRFSRLYPTYWGAGALTFIAVYFFGLQGRGVSSLSAIANLLMFHEYFRIPHVDGVYWTLTVELTFYFWMLILYITVLLKKIEWIFGILILISVLHSLDILNIPWLIYKLLILEHISFFAAGVCFFKISNVEGNSKGAIVVLILSLLSTVFNYSFSDFIIFAVFYLLFFLAISGHLQILAIKPLLFLGSVSYSLYLLHQNIGYIIINKFYELQLNPVFGILVSIVVSIMLAALLTRYVEGPSIRLIRNRYRSKK